MAVQTLESGFISDTFSFETRFGVFSDAIVLSLEDYSALSAEDIETLKQQRLTNWLAVFEPSQEAIVIPTDPTQTLQG